MGHIEGEFRAFSFGKSSGTLVLDIKGRKQRRLHIKKSQNPALFDFLKGLLDDEL